MNAVNDMGDTGDSGVMSSDHSPAHNADHSGAEYYTMGSAEEFNDSRDENEEYMPRQTNSQSPKYTRRPASNSDAFDTSAGQPFMNDPRMNRIALAEAALREDMFKECTFRPKIKPLPDSYGAMKDPGVSFISRATKWQKEKELQLSNKEKMLRMGKEAECTFNPKINRNSDKAIKDIRGAEYSESANDRLYRNSELYQQQRNQLINEVKEKEEQLYNQECPFQPSLVTKDTPIHKQVMSRFKHEMRRDNDSDAGVRTSKDCTFTPKINKVKPNMSSAKLYLSTNVVDRLTRPIAGEEDAANDVSGAAGGSSRAHSQGDGADQMFDESFDQASGRHRPVLDMASFMGSLDKAQHTPAAAGNANTANKQNSRPMTEQEKAQRKEQFAAFLARQQYVMKKKEDFLKQVEKSQAPKFKPEITKKAQALGGGADAAAGSSTTRANFMTRIDMEIRRRQANEQSSEMKSDPNCTFRPQINRKLNEKQSKPRSSFDLSKGDMQRIETNRSKLKLEADQQALADATFRPTLSKRAQKAKSVLRLNSDPGQFLAWHKNSTMQKEQRRLELLRQKEEEEAKECSFSPKTTECPAYVKRIAKSMSIVKAARNSTGSYLDPEANKPQWR